MKKLFILILCVLLIPYAALAELTVYFLDVWQGDCAIIECDGEAMIIDGGLPGQSSKVYSFIENNLHFKRFVCMVATHPDNDHIGGLPGALQVAAKLSKQPKYIYTPVTESDSPRFKILKDQAEKNHVKMKTPYNEQKEHLGHAIVTFYNCGRAKQSIARSAIDWVKAQFNRDVPEENKENNDMSLVVKIKYGETSFLFTGDIETDAENRLIGDGIDLRANVLKVAHHGSGSSSSPDFLEKVNPQYAVISCGEGNQYHHPAQKTLSELDLRKIKLYRTDLQGTIICHSDGHEVTFEAKEATSDLFTAPEKNQ